MEYEVISLDYKDENGDIEKRLIDSVQDMEKIEGFPIDHSFLTFKKELSEYGFKVGKISLKEKTVAFEKN